MFHWCHRLLNSTFFTLRAAIFELHVLLRKKSTERPQITLSTARSKAPHNMYITRSVSLSPKFHNVQLWISVCSKELKSYAQRTFRWASAALWNNLPPSVRAIENLDSFKAALKTHLYMAEYCTALDTWFYYWYKLILVIIIYIYVSPGYVFLIFTYTGIDIFMSTL